MIAPLDECASDQREEDTLRLGTKYENLETEQSYFMQSVLKKKKKKVIHPR